MFRISKLIIAVGLTNSLLIPMCFASVIEFDDELVSTAYCGSVVRRLVLMGAPTDFIFLTFDMGQGPQEVALTGANDTARGELSDLQLPIGGKAIFCAYAVTPTGPWAFGEILSVTKISLVPWMPSASSYL
jgi:hypothetical protein